MSALIPAHSALLYYTLLNCNLFYYISRLLHSNLLHLLEHIFPTGSSLSCYDSQSKYKSLLVSEQTTVDELIQMLLSCYSSKERVEQFSLYEVCEGEEYQRKLHPDDSPLRVTQLWTSADRHLRIRRNPDYNPHRRKVRPIQTRIIKIAKGQTLTVSTIRDRIAAISQRRNVL